MKGLEVRKGVFRDVSFNAEGKMALRLEDGVHLKGNGSTDWPCI